MKQKDIFLIVVIMIISAVFSAVLSSIFFAPPKKDQKVETVDRLSAVFAPPDSKYFNDKSINPTQLIKIGDSTNTTPFSDKKQ